MDDEKKRLGFWQAARDWFDRAYDEHLQRYYGWNQRLYRICVWTAVGAAALIVLLPTLWLGRIGYRHFAEKHYASQARAFLERGDYRNAALSAKETLHLNHTNLAACRVMARLASLDHSPQVLNWQQRVVGADPTLDNKLDLAAMGLIYQKPPFSLSSRILTELAATGTNNARYQMVAADLAMRQNCLADAETHFEAALRLDPTNQMYALNLALLRLGMDNESKKVQSRAVLDNLRTNEALGLIALRTLVADRLKARDAAAANRYSTELLAQPQATLADQLQNLGILRRLGGSAFTNRLKFMQQTATNGQIVAEVSTWMQANGLLTEDLQWLTALPDSLRTKQPVQVALAQGYLQSENWLALRDFAVQGNWDNLEYLRLALVSRALSELGNFQVAKNNWDAALNEADHHLEPLTKLLRLAESWRLAPETEDLLLRIAGEFPKERWAQQSLGRFYFTTGNTAAMNRLSDRLKTAFPMEIEYKNNLAATALLLHTNLTQAGKWAAEIYAQSPGDPSVASTYAYALHLQGRDQEGLAVLQKLPPQQLKQPSLALYYGLILASAGQTDEAAPYLQIARAQGQLWPEEKQLLATALGGAGKSRRQ